MKRNYADRDEFFLRVEIIFKSRDIVYKEDYKVFEEKFEQLLVKYKDFNWFILEQRRDFFNEQAKREIGQGHMLYGHPMYAVAKCDSNDDVIYALGENKYVIIHLTYSSNINSDFPHYMLFETAQEVLQYIEEVYLTEYI